MLCGPVSGKDILKGKITKGSHAVLRKDLQTFRYQVVSAPRRFGPGRFSTKSFWHLDDTALDVLAPRRFGT